MFLGSKDRPILDDGYGSMVSELDFLFDGKNLDFTTALSLFYLSYELENVKWSMMPFRQFVRNVELSETLGEISTEIYHSCKDVSSHPRFQGFVDSLEYWVDFYDRYEVAQALTRAGEILAICEKYKDRLDYKRASRAYDERAYLTTQYSAEAKATMALIMICSFLKYGGMLMTDDEETVVYVHGAKSPILIYNVLLKDINRKSSGKQWFSKHTGAMMKSICKTYSVERWWEVNFAAG